MTAQPRGRRPGSPDTRALILDAARTLFAERGFAGTSVRAIAAAAGVDPALVHHYFGRKDDLFIAALRIPVDPRTVIGDVLAGDGGIERAGERLVRTLLGVWEDPDLRVGLLGLARGFLDPSGGRLLRDGFLPVVLVPLGTALGVDRPEVRMPLVASQVAGLILLRYLLAVEPLASLPVEDLVSIYAPTVQRYLSGPLPS